MHQTYRRLIALTLCAGLITTALQYTVGEALAGELCGHHRELG